MQTPVARYAGHVRTLYGEIGGAINRRAVIGGGIALLATTAAAKSRAVTAIAWTGRAHVEVGGRALDLVVETRVAVPLLRVRATSWIATQGPASARTMILEPDGQWLERLGTRTALPPELGIHERQQYALYAWLLHVQHGRRHPPGPLRLSAPPYPDIVFAIGADGFPIAADLTVDAPEPAGPRIAEHVVFSGRIDRDGIRWPRRFAIAQDGRPYFTLEIERLTVERG